MPRTLAEFHGRQLAIWVATITLDCIQQMQPQVDFNGGQMHLDEQSRIWAFGAVRCGVHGIPAEYHDQVLDLVSNSFMFYTPNQT